MNRTHRIIWRAVGSGKELLCLEGDTIIVPPFTINRNELVDLQAAVADCLGLLDSRPPVAPLEQEVA